MATGSLSRRRKGLPRTSRMENPQGSCSSEGPWRIGRSADSSSGGRKEEAAEVASIVEELRKLYPIRRHISRAMAVFIGTLLGIGLTNPQVRRMFARDRGLFARSSEAFLERWELMARHGVTAAGFRALLQRDMRWLSKPLQEVESTILYAESLLGGPGEAAARVFTLDPHLLSCSVANLEEKAQALQREGVLDLARVIAKFPNALSQCTPQEITNKMAALKGPLGRERALALLERDPRVLRANAGVLRELLAWLEKTFGRAAALQLAATPKVTGAKVETASATYTGLVGKFGEARARRMLLVQPRLLPFKWCTLDAKVEYLTKELGHTLDEVASCPTALTVSLEGRIRLRAAALQAAGKAYSCLSSLLKYSDKQFEKAYGVRLRQAAAAASSEAEASHLHSAS